MCLLTDGVVLSPDDVVACSCVYRLASVIVPKVVPLVESTVQFTDPAAVAITKKFAGDLVLLGGCPPVRRWFRFSLRRLFSNVVDFFGIVLVEGNDWRVRRYVTPSASLWCTSADVWYLFCLVGGMDRDVLGVVFFRCVVYF